MDCFCFFFVKKDVRDLRFHCTCIFISSLIFWRLIKFKQLKVEFKNYTIVKIQYGFQNVPQYDLGKVEPSNMAANYELQSYDIRCILFIFR